VLGVLAFYGSTKFRCLRVGTLLSNLYKAKAETIPSCVRAFVNRTDTSVTFASLVSYPHSRGMYSNMTAQIKV